MMQGGVLGVINKIPKQFYTKLDVVSIDNTICKLHNTVTFLILIVASLLVTAQEFLGESIRCISDKQGIPEKVMNTFCFFTSTFTVVKNYNANLLKKEALAHPGVGPMVPGADEKIQHSYYQWVPFVLFLQGLMFSVPYYLWRHTEGGRMKAFVLYLENCHYAWLDKETISEKTHNQTGGIKIPSKMDRNKRIHDIKEAFKNHLHVNYYWSIWLIFYELLYAVNLILQVYFTNVFLGGQFSNLGPQAIEEDVLEGEHILDVIFPKVTKCTFHKYGPSGTIQSHDAICVLALNILNEKIFSFLWFWYVLLGVLTLIGLIYRPLSMLLHSRSYLFNKLIFSPILFKPKKYDKEWMTLKLTKEFHYTDWLFLSYLSSNVDPLIFRRVFMAIAEDLDQGKNEDKSPLKMGVDL